MQTKMDGGGGGGGGEDGMIRKEESRGQEYRGRE